MLSPVNLRNELVRERSQQQQLLNRAQDLLKTSAEKDTAILSRLRRSGRVAIELEENIIDAENVFTLQEIRSICIRYRLRFLESSYFRSDFPYEAILRIKDLELKTKNEIQSFYIVAPGKAFELENINKDPLLFAPIGDDKYYLLHQWGKDLAWHKRFLLWPLQSFKTFFISLWILCATFVFSIPESVMHSISPDAEIYLRLWLMVHAFIGMLGISFWLGLTFDKTFSSSQWRSPYYNY